MPLLQFEPLTSSIEPTFWHALTSLKIDVLQLSDDAVPIRGSYERGRWVKNRESGGEVGIGGEFHVDGKAFQTDQVQEPVPGRVVMKGLLKNFNTVEDFKKADKATLFNTLADQLWNNIDDEDQASFLVFAFADLKKYRYTYWFTFPAFLAEPGWQMNQEEWTPMPSDTVTKLSRQLQQQSSEVQAGSWLGKKTRDGEDWIVSSVSSWSSFFEGVDPTQRYVIFIDPSSHSQAAGWPLRNLLSRLYKRHGDQVSGITVIAWRDHVGSHESVTPHSITTQISLATQDPKHPSSRPTAVGWERNHVGKLRPRLADLGPMMDPTRLADQAVSLNLKLMRWRILPQLDLEKIASTRCLLLGAGTLGCYVARSLLAWGVRKITLLDSSKVSFSNPVRQPLFEFSDCLQGGKSKAECAAEALKRIYPGVDASGIELSIPMPGHPISSHLHEKTKKDVETLQTLIDEHDVIYLLMDSRESRWLPSVIGAVKGKLIINAALGFDSYLVMRHGLMDSKVQSQTLGCYFCNDIVAPMDSLTDRTLDQMCTVTRPGLAAIASATAVELMTTVLQHPLGAFAPCDVPPLHPHQNHQQACQEPESVLGQVPHQIRGFLARFETLKLLGSPYSKCTACSPTVMEAYRNQGFDVLLEVFNDSKYLEKLTGLDKMHEESEAVLEAVDWDEGDDDEEADF